MIKFEQDRGTIYTYKNIEEIINLFPEGIQEGLYEGSDEIVQEIRRLIKSPPKTGRVYIINGRKHQASAPGEAPANLTGRLQKSASYKIRGWKESEIGESAPYAGILEEGRGRIAERPHIRKAMVNKQIDVLNSICDGINSKIK